MTPSFTVDVKTAPPTSALAPCQQPLPVTLVPSARCRQPPQAEFRTPSRPRTPASDGARSHGGVGDSGRAGGNAAGRRSRGESLCCWRVSSARPCQPHDGERGRAGPEQLATRGGSRTFSGSPAPVVAPHPPLLVPVPVSIPPHISPSRPVAISTERPRANPSLGGRQRPFLQAARSTQLRVSTYEQASAKIL